MSSQNAKITHDSRFFESIPPIENLSEITVTDHYHDVPSDWYIALTDVVNSTEAIEKGKYKDVNSIAAAAITALINRVRGVDLPFVFGGDGATVLLPPDVIPEAWNSLLATGQLARESFGLELRGGLIPVQDVLDAGYHVRVARLKMSENFSQAIFTGGGTGYAEKLLKDPSRNAKYLVQGTGSYEADFTGFECRWNTVQSPGEETISLLVQTIQSGEASNRIYREVLEQIDQIYGDRKKRHPITSQHLRLRWNPLAFWTEARIRYRDTSLPRLMNLAWKTLLGRLAIAWNLQGWGKYPQLLIEATDSEKFDDVLRMIISGSSAQREQLREFLEAQHQQGNLVYGIHIATGALVTCIVQDHFGKQVHFVDATDGGYAMASKALKAQLKMLESPVQSQVAVS